MKRRHLNLTAEAWRSLRRAWRPPSSPTLVWQRFIAGPVLSKVYALQTQTTKDVRERANLNDALVILGYWRSGTTLLHELLAASGRWAYPTTHDCMNPQSFALNAGRVDLDASVRRPMDDMVVSSQSPQEDEFALLGLGARSPYEALLFPRALGPALALADPLDLTTEEEKRWCDTFLGFCEIVSGQRGGLPLLLKSPLHACRITVLRKLLPGCRFVLMVRDPYAVFESTTRMWRTLFDCYALTPAPALDEIRADVLVHRPVFEAKLAAGLRKLAPHEYTIVHYERLVADPVAIIAKLYSALELDGAEMAVAKAAKEAANRANYRAHMYLPPDAWLERVRDRWHDFFVANGYAL
jgi:omega-hydroxy-beta-dihydromenaquinone-9 sulfotransferase